MKPTCKSSFYFAIVVGVVLSLVTQKIFYYRRAVTLGDQGVLLMSRVNDGDPTVVHFPGHKDVVVKNATGAGDTFTGAVVNALLKGNRMATAVGAGMEAAVVSLQCADRAISPDLE